MAPWAATASQEAHQSAYTQHPLRYGGHFADHNHVIEAKAHLVGAAISESHIRFRSRDCWTHLRRRKLCRRIRASQVAWSENRMRKWICIPPIRDWPRGSEASSSHERPLLRVDARVNRLWSLTLARRACSSCVWAAVQASSSRGSFYHWMRIHLCCF